MQREESLVSCYLLFGVRLAVERCGKAESGGTAFMGFRERRLG